MYMFVIYSEVVYTYCKKSGLTCKPHLHEGSNQPGLASSVNTLNQCDWSSQTVTFRQYVQSNLSYIRTPVIGHLPQLGS